LEWYENHFKTEPHPEKSLTDLYDEEASLSSKLAMVRTMIHKRETWMDRRNAALYAWNTKDKDKEWSCPS
jgi:hypothetical protein